ncbi:MAG: hypothetical protein A2020_05435 [Lentisphaerae bacterium GWF2_45_14]|nr:MAG: hypothetical protein A2020_05435 [Lentisphaerae bacterium GWF2_45_14]
MAENPYDRFLRKELILRDELAVDRTILANERTLMAYLRSALTLFIAGITFLHFFEFGELFWIGIAAIPSGLIVAVFGVLRYRTMNASIRAIRDNFGKNSETAKPQDSQ